MEVFAAAPHDMMVAGFGRCHVTWMEGLMGMIVWVRGGTFFHVGKGCSKHGEA